jgi:hypothetical protein
MRSRCARKVGFSLRRSLRNLATVKFGSANSGRSGYPARESRSGRYRAFGDAVLIKPGLRMSIEVVDFVQTPVLSSGLIDKGPNIYRPCGLP